MAVYDWIKCETLLLAILVYSCVGDNELVNNIDKAELQQTDKRLANEPQFWKRDTDKSIASFWKRGVDDITSYSAMNHDEDEDEKRRSQFLGKRRAQFLGKRRAQFLGKRSDELVDDDEYLSDEGIDDYEKRARQAFLGKRGRQAFLGKRGRQAFLGKRRQAFLGKRDESQFSPAEIQEYLEEIDNGAEYEKRARQAFLGKRGRQAFLGKRSDYDQDDYGYKRFSYLGKRPRLAFLGKRSYDDLIDVDEKRGRQAFLGKRSVDESA